MCPNITVAETLNPSWSVAEPLSCSPLSYAFVPRVLRPCHCRALEQAACRLLLGPKPKPRVFVGSPVLHENPGFGKTHVAQEGTQAVALGGKNGCSPLRSLIPICCGPAFTSSLITRAIPTCTRTKADTCVHALPKESASAPERLSGHQSKSIKLSTIMLTICGLERELLSFCP